MLGVDVEVFKDIPGYKAILKAVLLGQIQSLVEQLSKQTGEESLLLTVSVEEGTLSHIGTDSGQFFIRGHDEIKSQFLGFCLKRNHFEDQVRKRGPPTKRPRLSHTLPATQPYATSTPRGRRKSTPRFMPSKGRRQGNLQQDPKLLGFDSTPSAADETHGADGLAVAMAPSEDADGVTTGNGEDVMKSELADKQANELNGVDVGLGGMVEGSDVGQDTDADTYTVVSAEQGEPVEGNDSQLNAEDNQMADENQSFPVKDLQQYDNGVKHPFPSGDSLLTYPFHSTPSSTEAIIAPHLRSLQSPYSPLHLSFSPSASDSQRPHCHLCGKNFKNANNLKIHMMSHNGVRPYGCPYCGRRFIQKNVLKQHMHIHTGQKEFGCEICGKAFTQRATLYKHRKVHETAKVETGTLDVAQPDTNAFDPSKQDSGAIDLSKPGISTKGRRKGKVESEQDEQVD